MAFQQGRSWRFSRRGQWQNGLSGNRPISYGLRNSRVVGGMRELASKLPIEFVDERVESAAHLRSFGAGRHPLLVNATTVPTLIGGEATAPKRMVLGAQVPFILSERGVSYPGDRDRIRWQASQTALDLVRRYFLYAAQPKQSAKG